MLAAAAIAHHRDARASSDRRDSGRGARGGARLGRHRCWGRRQQGGRHVVCRRGWACLSYLHRCAPGTRRIPCRCFGVPDVEIVGGDLQGCELQPTRQTLGGRDHATASHGNVDEDK